MRGGGRCSNSRSEGVGSFRVQGVRVIRPSRKPVLRRARRRQCSSLRSTARARPSALTVPARSAQMCLCRGGPLAALSVPRWLGGMGTLRSSSGGSSYLRQTSCRRGRSVNRANQDNRISSPPPLSIRRNHRPEPVLVNGLIEFSRRTRLRATSGVSRYRV